MSGRWHDVAAPGTDPALLADLVAAMRADEATTRRRVAELLDAGRPAAEALRAVAPARLVPDPDDDRLAETWADHGVRVALLDDPGCPRRVGTVADPPPFLAVRGDVTRLDSAPVVAIVGARAATDYGRGVAAWLAESAAQAGVHVISGGAVGIDGAAHGAAVEPPGRTSVVLGCGHDVPYPRPHAAPGGLFARVVEAGGAVLSECLPSTPPRAPRVRARNRLVAGLADVVVVVEGGPRSGSLITATQAGERGATVMAVPGDVRAPGSAAPHRLLVEGAVPCTGPQDLLDVLGRDAPATAADCDASGGHDGDAGAGAGARGLPSVLPDPVRRCLTAAWPRPVDLESLARDAGMPTGALLAALTRARVAGEVAQGPSGAVLRRRP